MHKHLFFFILIAGLFSGLHISAQIPERAEDISPLLIGETIPDATLTNPDGKQQQFSDIIGNQPAVLLFYRGGWCPYCNVHLSEIQEVEDAIIQLGYKIVGISPDSPENLQQTDEKEKLNYSLFSDADGTFTKGIGIAFKAPERMSDMLAKSSDGKNEGILPVPSVFVVDTSGKILFEYINPDFRTRMSARLLLAVLKELQPGD
ncbi:MAG: peroxiredoxin-like family protein [Bacteroidales bacterium]